jgi:ATP-dependent helicase YprA (DUF1998 family)
VVKSDPIDALTAVVFGFALRPSQRRAVDSVVAGRDTLVVLPTGSGKSAIYQTAGLARGGLTVVISPLIALQRDQLRGLATRRHPDGRAISAAEINSGQPVADRRAALAALAEGRLDFVLLGPEQLNNEQTHAALIEGALAYIGYAAINHLGSWCSAASATAAWSNGGVTPTANLSCSRSGSIVALRRQAETIERGGEKADSTAVCHERRDRAVAVSSLGLSERASEARPSIVVTRGSWVNVAELSIRM